MAVEFGGVAAICNSAAKSYLWRSVFMCLFMWGISLL